MYFGRIAGALALIAAISEIVLILVGMPGHSIHNGRAAGEALGSAIAILAFISIPAGITVSGAVRPFDCW